VRSKSLDGVIEKGHVVVKVHVEEPATIFLTAAVVWRGERRPIARKKVFFDQAGARIIRMKLTRKGRRLLEKIEEKRGETKVKVFARAVDQQGFVGKDKASRHLG
jgi:hypothetical protein